MFTIATVDLALGVMNSTLKLGRRLDQILVEHKLGNPIPFKLPSEKPDVSGYRNEVLDFFASEKGMALRSDDIALRELWRKHNETTNIPGKSAYYVQLFERWALFNGIELPKKIDSNIPNLPIDSSHVNFIGYYLVDAAKPGHQRSAVIDVALAAADVALEFAGSNPALITRDPDVQKSIRTFLLHFTEGDLEKDPGYRQLFDRALGSVIHTAIEHRDLVEDEKALSIFLESLAKAKEADGGDFIAGLVGGKGFDKVLQSLVQTLGENIDRFTDDQVVIDIIGGILKDTAEDSVFKAILGGKEGSLATVAQIAITHTAKYPVLLEKIGGDEVWHGVLKEVLKQVASTAEKKKLFTDEALGSLVSAALRGVAQDSTLLSGKFVERLVASVADSLSTKPVKNLFGESSLKFIASAVLESAAEHVDLLVKDDKLLAAVLGAVMEEGAKGFSKGFDRDFAIELAIAAIDAVAANASAIKLPAPFGEMIGTVIKELSRDELRKNLASADIVAIFTEAVQIVAANPHLWENSLANGKVPASVIRSIAKAVANDPTNLLSGPVLGSLVVEVLDAVSLRSKAYATIINEYENEELSLLLEQTLNRLKDEVGVSLGADNVVSVIAQMVLEWGKQQFVVQVGNEAFEKQINNALRAA